MKGVILAAGKGSRLMPLTKAVPKGLLPIYDKPMIFYPLSLLLMLGIREVAIVVSLEDRKLFEDTLGNGSELGLKIKYVIQGEANGSAGAFRMAKSFVKGSDVVVLCCDNILIGEGVYAIMESGIKNLKEGYSSILTHTVQDAKPYGVVEMEKDGFVSSIVEKPKKPKSNLIALGIYFYTKDVVEKMYKIDKSARGEYEITDLNKLFIKEGRLKAVKIKKAKWYDAGNADALLEVGVAVKKMYNSRK